MRKFLLIAPLMIGSHAYAAEDPAIVVCEEIAKARIKTPKSYERVSAEIHANRVYLVFDAVNVYNAPIRDHYECAFELSDEGKFQIIDATVEEVERERAAIAEEVERYQREGSMPPEKRVELNERLQALLTKGRRGIGENLENTLFVQRFDFYPINHNSTSLKSSPTQK
jgi:hypothetical protein